MKRGAFKRRARDLSVMLFVLVCATILIWTWDRAPLLSAFLPPEDNFIELQAERKDEKISGVVVTETKESYSSTSPFDHYEDRTEHKDSGEEEKQVELQVSVDETDEVKKVTTDEKQVENKSIVSETEVGSRPNTEENSEPESKIQEEVETRTAHSETKEPDESNLPHSKTQACNYAKGKWVVDDRHPLYSGSGCKQWLAPMWACRLMQRKDFAFEKLRWQPKDCDMEEFEGSKFLKRMQNKTLAFVGDSLGRQQFQSMMCMITGGEERPDVMDVGPEFGLITPEGGGRPGGWAYRFPETSTTVLYYWSATLCDIEPLNATDPATEYAMHLDHPPAFLRQYLHKIDILVLNTGHHWNRGKLNGNRWVMHVDGIPNTNKKLAALGNAKNFTIHSIVRWVNSRLPHHPGLKAFYRSISPRHFFGGEWNTGGSCDNTTPMSVGKEVLQDESSDYSAGHSVVGTGVKLLDITAMSQVRDEGHISRFSLTAAPGVQDCLHWCLPGVPDTWNEILSAMI
ncbi:PREDICTED: protein trichome birefringence-like 16 isoform X2 [Tarenaya hassleriana]|uniref:protein trichome birefringence-like 16 isoform X2 n=1 Tax=Tarenaya hassleriana TaxID=28532 RepID=UPI00053CA4C5|nr:PREDICTED: protein trichome birefringence-like 16 isoform X2 [Tarenaya hassleriana]